MRSIIRNVRILRDPAGTSLADYKQRFRCYVVMDVFYGILFAVICVASIAGAEGVLGPEYSAGKGVLMAEVAPALVSFLFLVDAALIVVMNKNIAKWPGSCTSGHLHKIINCNIASNSVTIIAYLGYRLRAVLNLLSNPGAVGTSSVLYVALAFFVLIALSKFSKVFVIWAFHRWLQAQPDASSGQLLPATMPVMAPIQGVVMAPPMTQPATGYQQQQAFQGSQA